MFIPHLALPGLPRQGCPHQGCLEVCPHQGCLCQGCPRQGCPHQGCPVRLPRQGCPRQGCPPGCPGLSPPFFNLHFLSSNIPLRNSTNNKMAFFPFIISKDFYGKILILDLYLLQIHFGFSSFSHPVNAVEACGLLTPLHIVPEWYFLCQYAMLKAVPNKYAGFIIFHPILLYEKSFKCHSILKLRRPVDLTVFIATPPGCPVLPLPGLPPPGLPPPALPPPGLPPS